jgi:cytochrome P450
MTHDLSFATWPWSPSVRVLVANGDAQGLVFARYGALWRQLRKICVLELLSAPRVWSFRHVREEEARHLIAGIAAVAPLGEAGVDVGRRITAAMMDSVIRAMIGDRFGRQEEFLDSLTEGLKIAAGFTLGDLFPSWKTVSLVSGSACRAEANHRKIFELMDSVIRQHQERRAAGGEVVEEDMCAP